MADVLSLFFSADFLFVIIRVGVPLLFASMSAYVASIAGIPNIAVEGIMIFGSLFGVYMFEFCLWSFWYKKDKDTTLKRRIELEKKRANETEKSNDKIVV